MIPAEAECLDALDWIRVERVPSRLLPDVEQLKAVMTCPGCKRRGEQPTHAHAFSCDCGVMLQLEGVQLYVWKQEPAPSGCRQI